MMDQPEGWTEVGVRGSWRLALVPVRYGTPVSIVCWPFLRENRSKVDGEFAVGSFLHWCVGCGRSERERAAGGEWKIFIFDCAVGDGGFVPHFCQGLRLRQIVA